MLSRPKDHLGRGPGTFLAIKAIALAVQWMAGEETGEKGGTFQKFGFNGRCRTERNL